MKKKISKKKKKPLKSFKKSLKSFKKKSIVKKKVAAKKKAAKKKAVKAKVKKIENNDNFNFQEEEWSSPYWAELKKMKVDRAVCEFEGGGDDGCIFDCKLYKTNGEVVDISPFEQNEKNNKIIETLGGPIWERYGGFNWFERCSGKLTWNVKKNVVEWTGEHDPEGSYD